jgi:hypothetical protein
MRDHYYDRKKKIQLSVWWVRDRYYDRKKKVLVVHLVGARLLLRPEKKNVLVICLAGARSLLRPENKKVLVKDTVVCPLLRQSNYHREKQTHKHKHTHTHTLASSSALPGDCTDIGQRRQGRCGGHGFRINWHTQGGHIREGKDQRRCDEGRGGWRRRACNRRFNNFFIGESFLLFSFVSVILCSIPTILSSIPTYIFAFLLFSYVSVISDHSYLTFLSLR